MEEQNERDFKGIWIPREIWFYEKLTALEKVVLMEIDSLDVREQGCYASNEYLSIFCQCTETKISLTIKKLLELDLVEIVSFDGRKRCIKIKRQTLTKLKADFNKIKDINIVYNKKNTIINNSIKKSKTKKLKKPTLEEVQEYCKERNNNIDAEQFIDYYEANGWKQSGNKPIINWKACIRTWERNNFNKKEEDKERKLYQDEDGAFHF